MKISEYTSEGLSPVGLPPATDTARPGADAAEWPARTHPIAPWWHTVFLVAFLVTVSVLTSIESKAKGFSGGHTRRYLFGIAWEWLLAALAWWGIRMGHVPVRRLLGQRRQGWRMWARDFGIALIFWLMAMIMLAALAAVLRLMHLLVLQKAVIELAPQSGVEMVTWLALCLTAGIVEEFVFRGYFLQQFASLGHSTAIKLWCGIVASSILFGISHGYEGIGGMIVITAYGAAFSILAVKRSSLRAGMMAHAWHDSLTGIALAIVKHLRVL